MVEDVLNGGIWATDDERIIKGEAAENLRTDRIERITVDYLRRLLFYDSSESGGSSKEASLFWYSEHIMLDRAEGMVEYIQNYDNRKRFFRRFYDIDGVWKTLDFFDPETLFLQIEGNPADTVENKADQKTYSIIVNYRHKPPLVLKGSYDKRGLPIDYGAFVEEVYVLMAKFGLGDIFNNKLYAKTMRRRNDYIFCSVVFADYGKSYYYISEDDSLDIGDIVLVPVGEETEFKPARVVNIEYFDKADAPYPLEKVKKIVRKCTDEDLKAFAAADGGTYPHKNTSSE